MLSYQVERWPENIHAILAWHRSRCHAGGWHRPVLFLEAPEKFVGSPWQLVSFESPKKNPGRQGRRKGGIFSRVVQLFKMFSECDKRNLGA